MANDLIRLEDDDNGLYEPSDKIYQFEKKLVDYRNAGIKLVWEVNPKFRFIRVHYLDRPPERLEESDKITGNPVLPGFAVLVRELLPPAP